MAIQDKADAEPFLKEKDVLWRGGQESGQGGEEAQKSTVLFRQDPIDATSGNTSGESAKKETHTAESAAIKSMNEDGVWLAVLPRKMPAFSWPKQLLGSLEETPTGVRNLSNDPSLIKLFNDTMPNYRAWLLSTEKERQEATLHLNLYNLYNDLIQDGGAEDIELVLGMAHFSGEVLDENNQSLQVDYPLFLYPCEITLGKGQCIEVRMAGVSKPTLAPFLSGPIVPDSVKGRVKDIFSNRVLGAEQGLDPSNPQSFLPAGKEILELFCHTPSVSTGSLHDGMPYGGMPAPSKEPTLSPRLTLFTRPRTRDRVVADIVRYLEKLDAMDTQAPTSEGGEQNQDNHHEAAGESVPEPALRLLGGGDLRGDWETKNLSSVVFRGACHTGEANVSGDDVPRELFFPLPYNDEQLAILERLEKNSGVVVQGPPGTGKSHTIANIISHYLAENKRVLVAATSANALSVIREKLPENIQKLTGTLLSSDRDSLREFEKSIAAISEYLSQASQGSMENEIAELLREIDDEHAKRFAIDAEFSEVSFEHESGVFFEGKAQSSLDLVVFFERNKNRFEWFSDETVNENLLYENLKQYGFDDSLSLFDKRLKFSAQLFGALGRVRGAGILRRVNEPAFTVDMVPAPQIWAKIQEMPKTPPLPMSRKEAIDLRTRLLDMESDLLEKESGAQKSFSLLTAGFSPEKKKEFHDFLKNNMISLESLTDNILLYFTKNHKQIFDLKKQARVHVDLLGNTEFKEKIKSLAANSSWVDRARLIFDKNKKYLQENTFVWDGKDFSEPKTSNDWNVLLRKYVQMQTFLKITKDWVEIFKDFLPLLDKNGDPFSSLDFAFLKSKDFSDDLKIVLAYLKDSNDCTDLFSDVARRIEGTRGILDAPHDLTTEEKNQFLARFEARIKEQGVWEETLFEKESADKKIAQLSEAAEATTTLFARWKRLWSQDDASYHDIYNLWEDSRRAHEHFDDLRVLRDFLQAIAACGGIGLERSLVGAFNNDTVPDFLHAMDSRDFSEFLRFAAIKPVVAKMPQTVDRVQSLLEKRRGCANRLRHLYEVTSSKKAWLGLLTGTTPSMRQHLQSYLNAVKKIGVTGKGARARRHQQVAREAMEKSYQAVPCWIMPEARVSESMPASMGLFDLLIIDEASQSNIGAFLCVLRAKKILVVGDDKQVSPQATGIAEREILGAKAAFLKDIPFADHMLQDSSFYDLALVAYAGQSIMLKEHFRCDPALIAYSNNKFYDGSIVPLRTPKAHEKLPPALCRIFVEDGFKDGDINEREAEVVAERIDGLLKQDLIKGRTIGVVTLSSNVKQSFLIRKKIDDKLSSHMTQDEQKAFKIAVGPPTHFQGMERDIMFVSMVWHKDTRGVGTRDLEQKVNVALSRARDRMYLVHSLPRSETKPDSLLSGILDFFEKAPEETISTERLTEFETDLQNALLARHIKVMPKIGDRRYTIDLVLEKDCGRVGVMCDGDGKRIKWRDSVSRQEVLERAGWTIARVFARDFYKDPESVLRFLEGLLATESVGTRKLALGGQLEIERGDFRGGGKAGELAKKSRAEKIVASLPANSANPSAVFDSTFEREIFLALSQTFCVSPQVECDGYLLDIVVHDGERHLVIECDGDRFHQDYDKDRAREDYLHRQGFIFHRVWASDFYKNKERVLFDIEKRILAENILPRKNVVP